MTPTKTQYLALVTLDRGEPLTLWPMMRKAFARAGWIRPADGPDGSRRFQVTDAGRAAIAAYEESTSDVSRVKVNGSVMKPQFGKGIA